MAFYTARAKLVLPSGDVFRRMTEASRELDETPEAVRTDDAFELYDLLDNMEGAFLLDLDGKVIDEITLTLLHYNGETGTLVLSVDFESSGQAGPHTSYATPFDALFNGQYDPEEARLGEGDVAYVVARVTSNGEVQGDVHVVQPIHEEDAPAYVCAATSVPPEFIAHLLALVA